MASIPSDGDEGKAGTSSTGPLWRECPRARHRMLPERRFGGCRCNIQALMTLLDQASCSRLAGGRPRHSPDSAHTLNRHSPYTIQIRGNRTTFPPPRELSSPMQPSDGMILVISARAWKATRSDGVFSPSRHTSPVAFSSPSIPSAYERSGSSSQIINQAQDSVNRSLRAPPPQPMWNVT